MQKIAYQLDQRKNGRGRSDFTTISETARLLKLIWLRPIAWAKMALVIQFRFCKISKIIRDVLSSDWYSRWKILNNASHIILLLVPSAVSKLSAECSIIFEKLEEKKTRKTMELKKSTISNWINERDFLLSKPLNHSITEYEFFHCSFYLLIG